MLKMLLMVLTLILFSGCSRTVVKPCEPIVQIKEVKVPVKCKTKKVECGKLNGPLDEQLKQTVFCLKRHKVELTRCSESNIR